MLTHSGDRIAIQQGVTVASNQEYCGAMARLLRKNRSLAGDTASLTLRISLSIALAILSVSSDTVSTPVSVTAAILGCLIGSGLLTRGAATASLFLVAFSDHDDSVAVLSIAAEALALVLVGAGIYSLDALVLRKRASEWPDLNK